MDLLSRCVAELSNADEIREQTDAVRSRVESELQNPRVAKLYAELSALDHALAQRARQVLIGAAQLEIGNACSEELELEAELTSYLVRKTRNTSEQLRRELGPLPASRASDYEEPLG
jgi:capsule polysaccharide export protein KpsE/RkpR